MRIGCCVPVEGYEWAVEAGYDYVELPAWQVRSLDREQMDALLAKKAAAGVPILRLNAYSTGIPAIAGPQADDAATRAYARALMRRAAALGVETVGIGAPAARRLPQDYDRHLADRQCERFLRITAAEAAPYGIEILLEAVRSGMCNYMNDLNEAAAMVKRVALPQVRLMADLYHMEAQGEDWASIRDWLADIRHVHVSTAGEGMTRGLYGAEDGPACLRAFRAMKAAGYNGTVSIEPDVAQLNENAMKVALALMRQACERAK